MEDTIKALLADLDAIGFADNHSPVSGSDCVDVVATHIEALRKSVEPIVKKKYTLIVMMDTDDDVMIEYNDCLYCYYRENLVISEQFDSTMDIIRFINEEIIVHDDYKVTRMTKQWLADCVDSINLSGQPAFCVSGNQEYSMNIIVNN